MKNIAELCAENGVTAASIHQFIFENRGTQAGKISCPYVSLGDNIDNSQRMNEMIKLLKGEEIGIGAGRVKLTEMPKFTAIYSDDLDGIGHNGKKCYGVDIAGSEKMRLKNILDRLEEMDRKLGDVVDACKETGIYDNISFFLTSDHGMTPYGRDNAKSNNVETCKSIDLIDFFKGRGYYASFTKGINDFDKDADILLLTFGLCVQVYFLKDIANEKKDEILQELRVMPFIEKALGRKELSEFCKEDFCDIYLSPVPPYHFSGTEQIAGAQHDSLNETSQHIFSLAWGNKIKKGIVSTEKIYNIDFMPVMCGILGIDVPEHRRAPGMLQN